MKLSSMRYKSFVWPHNPRVYTITFQRNMAVQKVPFGRYRLQSLGLTRRVMRGEGEFTGEDAYRQFKALASVFYEETPGILVHPLWDTTSAWFTGLELAQEPREDYVKYRFEFWEDFAGYQTGVEEKKAAPVEAEVQPSGSGGGNSAGNAGGSFGGNFGGSFGGSTAGDAGGNGWSVPAAPVAEAESGAAYHTVTQGQTLWGLARQYGVGLDELIALNPQLKNPNLIYVGQKIRVK